MPLAAHIITYVCVAVFVIAVAARVIRYVSAPLHVRWELYPVPHDISRAHYGGSYLEEPEWWKKPCRHSLFGMAKGMAEEILLIKSLWDNNRELWYRTYPFHLGLYLLSSFVALNVFNALVALCGFDSAPAALALHVLAAAAAHAGMVLTILGALGMLYRRLTHTELQGYTSAGAILNLSFILVACLVASATAFTMDPGYAAVRQFTVHVIGFRGPAPVASLVAVEIIVAMLLIAYVPITHMSHFFMKYFMYHHVRWDDAPSRPGSRPDAQTRKALQYPVTWAASHIRGDGKKTWADVATEDTQQ